MKWIITEKMPRVIHPWKRFNACPYALFMASSTLWSPWPNSSRKHDRKWILLQYKERWVLRDKKLDCVLDTHNRFYVNDIKIFVFYSFLKITIHIWIELLDHTWCRSLVGSQISHGSSSESGNHICLQKKRSNRICCFLCLILCIIDY
jgi:hypothetical protein